MFYIVCLALSRGLCPGTEEVNACFIWVENFEKTQADAETYCIQTHNAHLTSIRTPAEYTFIKALQQQR